MTQNNRDNPEDKGADSAVASPERQLIKYAQDMARLYQDLRTENQRLVEAHKLLESSYYQTVLLGYDLINLYDEYLGSHCKRVAYYAGQIAEELSLDEPRKLNILFASTLHDIGLVGMDQSVLLEILRGQDVARKHRVTYHDHPTVSIRPFTSSDRFKRVAQIVAGHHESMDGTGFPKGLAGDQILLESRILAVADEYDLTRERSPEKLSARMVFDLMQYQGTRALDPLALEALKAAITRDGDPFTREQSTAIEDLVPGMIIAKTVTSKGGLKLLGAGTVLRVDHIQILKRFYKSDNLTLPLYTHSTTREADPAFGQE